LTGLGNYWNDAISAGDTYLRVHLRWGFHLDTPWNTNIEFCAVNLVTFGLCTTVGNGSETPPEAASASADAAPPTQRWIYWETLAPVVEAASYETGLIYWRNSAQTEPTQTKGQVLATGLGEGETLNLWASWQSAYDWADFGANAVIWHSVSILRKNDTP
jgi:hypothetical protein